MGGTTGTGYITNINKLTEDKFYRLTAMKVDTIDFEAEKEPDGRPISMANLRLSKIETSYDWRIKDGDKYVAKIFNAPAKRVWDLLRYCGLRNNGDLNHSDIEIYVSKHKNRTHPSRKRLGDIN